MKEELEDLQAFLLALGEQLEFLNEALEKLPENIKNALPEPNEQKEPIDTTEKLVDLATKIKEGNESIVKAIKDIPQGKTVDLNPLVSKLDEHIVAMNAMTYDRPETPDMKPMMDCLVELKNILTKPIEKEDLKPLFEKLERAVRDSKHTIVGGGSGMSDVERASINNTATNTLNINNKVATAVQQTNGTQKTQIVDGEGTIANIDQNGAAEEITTEHHRIHRGQSFHFDDVIQLGLAGAQDYLLTADSGVAHFGYILEGVFGVTVELFEATDKTGTTSQTLYNRNRNSATTPTLIIHKGTSGGTTDGTRIAWRKSGSGSAGGRLSGSSSDASERILKTATKYILRITSAANLNDISLQFNWYEI